MGAVTPIGIGVDNYWNSLISGVCGIEDISCIDTSALPIKQAAEVHNFNPKDYLPGKLVHGQTFVRMGIFCQIRRRETLADSRRKQPARKNRLVGVYGVGVASLREKFADGD